MKINVRQSNIDSYQDYLYMEYAVANINKTIDLFCRLIKEDNISFYEYINIINRIYKVQITNNDLLRISSIILGGPSKSTILNTDMMYDIIKHIEVTNYFEYYQKEDNLYLKVAFTDDKDIDFNHRYSSGEINEMINNKKIVFLDFVLNEEDDMNFYEEDEINGLSPINNVTGDNFINLLDIREDYIPSVITYLKSYFTIDRLKSDLDNYIRITKVKLDTLENYIKKKQSSKFTRVNKYNSILREVNKIKKRKISKK